MMKISVSSYSFEQYISSKKFTFLDTVKCAYELGFEAIEFDEDYVPGDSFKEKLLCADKIRNEADKYGMKINAYVVGGNLYHPTVEGSTAEVKRLCSQVDVAEILGCSVLRHDVCYSLGTVGCSRSFGLMLPTISQNVRRVTEYAAMKGITTCTENHGFIAQDSYRVEQLFNAVQHDNFGLLVDIGNFVCVDEDNVTAVSRVAPYAVHVHVKDMYISSEFQEGYAQTRACNYFKGSVIGEGDVNVERCLQILNKAGYNGFCSIEFEGSEDCIYGITKSRENLIRMIEHLA